MDEITNRLETCFRTVFPDLPAAEIGAASQSSIAAWDSIAAITLVNVIEEEFGIQLDLDLVPELDSFGRVEEYLQKEMHAS